MGVLSVPINDQIMCCMSWQEVLALVHQRGDVMCEVNIVTALHRAAKLWREEDAGTTPIEEIRASAGIQSLMKLTRHFAVRCRPQQLSNAVWACAVLMHQDGPLLQRLCDFAVERLGGYTPQNAANTVWALATLAFQHTCLLDLIPAYVEANVRDFSPQDLANTCWAYARLQYPSEMVFQLILTESVVRLSGFQAQNMSNLVWACATLLVHSDSDMLRISSIAAERVEEFSTQELSNLNWGMATLNLSCDIWLDSSGQELARRSRECCPQDLSNTIWAWGTLKYKRNEVMRTINWEVMRQIEWFSPQGLSNFVWGLSAMEYRDIKALTCLSEEVTRRPLEQFTPPDISTLLYSFAVLAWVHDAALAKLRRAIRRALPIFATRDVANISWAMVTLSHRDDDIFRRLMDKSVGMMPDFSLQGLCNIAWAFVRFGVQVPRDVAVLLAEETMKRRDELREEPGDAVLLSDAICSEWVSHVPRPLLEVCDAVGREQFDRVFAFFADWSNVPRIECEPAEAEQYQALVTGFRVIQLGRRLTVEILRRFGVLEESDASIHELRPLREKWILDEVQQADPSDATMQHKTTCTWMLDLPAAGAAGAGDAIGTPHVLASGSPMNAPVRFVSCIVEHPRASDAEFQVVNKVADLLLRSGCCASAEAAVGTLRFDVSEIPCLSCLGAIRQFQKAFPKVHVRMSFNIRKVSEVCKDMSGQALEEPKEMLPRTHIPIAPGSDRLPPPPTAVPDNRGRGPAGPGSRSSAAPAKEGLGGLPQQAPRGVSSRPAARPPSLSQQPVPESGGADVASSGEHRPSGYAVPEVASRPKASAAQSFY